jgi:Protein of unknown function (DUF1566)/EF hand
MIRCILSVFLFLALGTAVCEELPYPVVDTGQVRCYDNRTEITYPKRGAAFFGQDAQYEGRAPKYRDNGDGTISDLNTGLMWQNSPGEKMSLTAALAGAGKCRLAGHADWRMPTIKELYSLIIFSGTDPDPRSASGKGQHPFIDARFFDFRYGDSARGERVIDSQYISATKYVSTTMHADETVFGVNFADGRIKGYPVKNPRTRRPGVYFVIYVRGNAKYGKNDFVENRDGTVTDRATGLMWMQVDSGALKAGAKKDGKLNWEQALQWAENLKFGGHSDWRLPDAKELQSIIDYSRSPATTQSAAIDKAFKVTEIVDEGGKKNYPFYWTSSTHASLFSGSSADYLCFGEALGWMRSRRTGEYELLDVHGAGAQRSDPKSGEPSKYPHGFGPQGDVRRIYNFVRCVRDGGVKPKTKGPKVGMKASQGRPGGNPLGFIEHLDKDGDGKVSKAEFDGPKRHFAEMDRNGDGFISKDEAPTSPPHSRGGRP